ncbi:putative membrane protein [Variovorax sp. TBS-050B]|uniref:DUF2177 family protein n=1 Tax=Variovorax sp. TBS-050B TaxID=2940551 RepID=UPI002474D43C|nr:DUF2177 family protein [Variovorax sp. TBS-050B]MDH6593412.1 putative membrane protein [Variovorax sp. TBS-050B]
MSLRQFAIAYLASAVVFLVLDAIWLSTMADRLYRPALGHLMLDRFSLGPAALFYAIYLVGVVVFAVLPALASGRWLTALGHGALLGLVAYATYDLTNQATLKGWPWMVTAADLCWGSFVTAVTAGVAAKVALGVGVVSRSG